MMKRALLLIILLLGAKDLFAQALYLPGTTVKGKGVEYEVFEHLYGVEVRNVENKDTVRVAKRQPNLPIGKPRCVLTLVESKEESIFFDKSDKKILNIIRRHLTKEERAEIVQTKSNLGFSLGLDKNGMVCRVVFIIFSGKPYSGFWQCFPPERFHQIELEISKKIKMREKYRGENRQFYGKSDVNFFIHYQKFKSNEKQKH